MTEGILESVDLESYRVVAQETMSISLADENAEIDPIPVSTDVGIPVPEMDTLDVYKRQPYQSYYHIIKTVEDDPLFDKKRAQSRLKYFVETNEYAIQEKANIIVCLLYTSRCV